MLNSHCNNNGKKNNNNKNVFCSVVAGGTSHFYSFCFRKFLARVDFLV